MQSPLTPEQHWEAVFAASLATPCQTCGHPCTLTMEDYERGFPVCPACAADLAEQACAWLAMDAGAGEV